MTSEPEPNGWVLLRGLDELKLAVNNMAAGVVTQAQHDAAMRRISALEANEIEQRKTKAQQWFAIGLSFLSMVGAVVAGVILYSIKGA